MTDKPVALRFVIKFEFVNVSFKRGKPEYPEENQQEEEVKEEQQHARIWHRVRVTNPGHWCIRIHIVGEFKTWIFGFELKCMYKDSFELTLRLRWTKRHRNPWQENNEHRNIHFYTTTNVFSSQVLWKMLRLLSYHQLEMWSRNSTSLRVNTV